MSNVPNIESSSRVWMDANDRKFGMTVKEMRAFMATVDESGMPDDARILAWANWKQSFYRVEVRANDTKQVK